MSEDEWEEYEKAKKENAEKKVIVVKHEGLPTSKSDNPDSEKTKEELESEVAELRGVLGQVAQEKFETERDTLLEQIKGRVSDEQLEAIRETVNTPEGLESTRAWIDVITRAVEMGTTATPKIQSGKARLDRQEFERISDNRYEATRQIIDNLYSIITDPTKSEDERKEANRKINELFGEVIRAGKERIQKGHELPTLDVMNCPACGQVMQGSECPNCGYSLPKWERER